MENKTETGKESANDNSSNAAEGKVKRLKVVSFKINNVLGVEDLLIDFNGNIIEISGGNAQGKTSCVEALKSIFSSSETGTLLRNGAKSGSAVLVLNDGSRLISSLKPGKSASRRAIGADNQTIGRAPAHIAGLFNANSLDPVKFLTATEKQKINMLFKSMPIKVNREVFYRICGERCKEKMIDSGVADDENIDAIALIAKARDVAYDMRTGDNRVANETNQHMRSLEKSTANTIDFDSSKLDNCYAQKETQQENENEKIISLRGDYAREVNIFNDQINAEVSKKDHLKKEYDRQCQIHDKEIALILERRKALNAQANANLKQSGASFKLKSEGLATEIKLLEDAKKSFEAREGVLKSIKDMKQTVEINTRAAQVLTTAIKNIDQYKAELLAKMPIKGLSVDNGKLMLDDVLFDRVNTARQVGVAMKLAELSAGDLKLIIADGLMDAMDAKTREEFYRQANKSSCQFVLTRVTNGPLSVSLSPDEDQIEEAGAADDAHGMPRSPNRLDACVYALTELVGKGSTAGGW